MKQEILLHLIIKKLIQLPGCPSLFPLMSHDGRGLSGRKVFQINWNKKLISLFYFHLALYARDSSSNLESTNSSNGNKSSGKRSRFDEIGEIGRDSRERGDSRERDSYSDSRNTRDYKDSRDSRDNKDYRDSKGESRDYRDSKG